MESLARTWQIERMAKERLKRPRDPVALAKLIGDIATGELDDEAEGKIDAAVARGKKGAKARAAKLSPERRQEIARAAADARWKKS